MSSFDIPINLNRLRHYHPHADALVQLQDNKGDDLSNCQFTVLTKHGSKKETEGFIDRLIELLTLHGFEDEYFALDLLFFSTFVYSDVAKLDAQYKDLILAKTTLKSLIYLMRIEKENKPSDIKIEVKGIVGEKAIITGSSFTTELLPLIAQSLKKSISSPIYNE